MAYAGHSFLPQIYALMSARLTYLWTCAITHSGGDPRFRNLKIQTKWKPILCFGKPPVDPWWDWFTDVATGTREKDTHPWQQAVAEAEHFIRVLTRPEGLVCDPFCGGGTTCLTARNLGREYIAFEIDEGSAKRATARLASLGVPDDGD